MTWQSIPLFLRRATQIASLCLFVWLVWCTAFPLLPTILPVDSFLRLDPVVAVGLPLLTRTWIPTLLPGLVLLALCCVVGRLFCGAVCPMGITLDMVRRITRTSKRRARTPPAETVARLARGKYLVLAVTLGATALGVNLLFWDAPIPLITRLYVIVIDPVRLLLGQWGVEIAQPFLYIQLMPRRYDTVIFTGLLFAGIFALEGILPRFWCRCLCPAGAFMALCSGKALWRRRIRRCEQCSLCVRHCPTGAIASDGVHTAHRECIACQTCVSVCPVQGVAFSIYTQPLYTQKKEIPTQDLPALMPSRRAFMLSTGAGIALGAVHLADVRRAFQSDADKGYIQGHLALRPPGALPEQAFLARCVRCGQCMRACPTNGLQPAWIEQGLAGTFSPVLVPRRGACEPSCAVCGHVCPSQAITPLDLAQKHCARMGTAVVVPGRCLAFSLEKRCMVCQEVCPYGAVKLLQKPEQRVPVPVVLGHRCFGCGYCEYHCPVRVSAIVVEAFHALRLPAGSDYRAEATARGFVLDPTSTHAPPEWDIAPGELPPGFTE